MNGSKQSWQFMPDELFAVACDIPPCTNNDTAPKLIRRKSKPSLMNAQD
jgi:hypothetical protein